MMKKYILTLILFFSCVLFLNSATVVEHRLSNGMKVWLNEDRSLPKVFGAVVVRAGAIDSPGTGIAHYFEHMAFKGTDKIGTVDYAKEKIYQDSIESYYSRLSIAKNEKEELAIQKEINRLSIEAAKYIIPNEFERLLQTYGGVGVNAGTGYDYTMYFNAFSPQYINQWCALNSERLINPVFRLFQSELETVYEEKNMMNNSLAGPVIDRVLDMYLSPSPYASSIIGTTANLKKPSMLAMRQYYDKFYNAANVDLLISGDINSDSVLAVLEKTFGQIPKGEPVVRNYPRAKKISGREVLDVKIPIPIMRGRILGWRGVTECDSDKVALNVAVALLSNSNHTGYLDSLSILGKCLFSGVLNQQLRYEGLLIGILVPQILRGTVDGVELDFFEQIDRLKQGDISEELLESVKLSAKLNYELTIENQEKRVSEMISLLGNGKTWDDFMSEAQKIDRVTKKDIMRVAKKYFNENYLCINKKTGSYPKEKIKKPMYAPIKPYNQGAKSHFAMELEKMESTGRAPLFLDISKDVTSKEIANGVRLYTVENNDNDIFSLNYRFWLGSNDKPILKLLEDYMTYVGTDSLSNIEYKKKLQRLGAEMVVKCNDNDFTISVTGYEQNFDATLALCSQYLLHLGVDEGAVKMIGEGNDVMGKSVSKDNNTVAHALLKYVQYADKSPYINRLSQKAINRLKASYLVSALDSLRSKELDITYYGKLPISILEDKLANAYQFSSDERSKVIGSDPQLVRYSTPTIYYIKEPKATQTIIYSYNNVNGIDSDRKKLQAKLIDSYIGGTMNSILFQEVREFRSLAYDVQSDLSTIDPKDYGKSAAFATRLSTQNDKAVEAILLLDSLLTDVHFDSLRLSLAKREVVNNAYQLYPHRRNVAEHVSKLIKSGYSSDPVAFEYNNIDLITADELAQLYIASFRQSPTVYIIVGDLKKSQLSQIKALGDIVKVSKKDILK